LKRWLMNSLEKVVGSERYITSTEWWQLRLEKYFRQIKNKE
jgi:hypothetical protein